jgi:16S rRNA (cytosine967-C5)-methyltransferase
VTQSLSPALWQQLQHTQLCLQQVLEGSSSTQVLATVPSQFKAATQSLLFLTLRGLGRANALLKQLATKLPKEPTRSLLQVSLAIGSAEGQSVYSDFTLVDQTVEAAKRDPAMRGQAAFVNACLRRFLRERDDLINRVQEDLTAKWNHPLWWIKALKKQYPAQWESILEANNQTPPLTLRVNTAKISRLELSSRWREQGLIHAPTGLQGLILQTPTAVQLIPGFNEGLCTVQDAGAQLAAEILMNGLSASDQPIRVLDACAAPGGKTTHLLEYPNVAVTALDVDPQRCEKVRENCERMGVSAQIMSADAADTGAWWDGQAFDAVLLDAPCTASGIVRRHPDIRWLRREQDLEQLSAQQWRILNETWRVLKPGGRLLFCTCSVFKQEGESHIQSFLRRNTDASICQQVGHLLPTLSPKGPLVTDNEIIDHDGFFYTLLQKKTSP